MVDDEIHISAMARDYLKVKGFAVDLIHVAEDAILKLKGGKYDICLLSRSFFLLAGQKQKIV